MPNKPIKRDYNVWIRCDDCMDTLRWMWVCVTVWDLHGKIERSGKN